MEGKAGTWDFCCWYLVLVLVLKLTGVWFGKRKTQDAGVYVSVISYSLKASPKYLEHLDA